MTHFWFGATMVHRFFLMTVLASIIFIFPYCNKSEESDSELLARVGNRSITVEEFVKRVEFSTLPKGMSVENFQGRRDVLDLLVGEKLYAIEAEKKAVQKDPVLRKKVRVIESAAIGRELYRDEVRKKVRVDEEEVREAYQRMKTKHIVRYIRTSSLEEAESWKGALDGGIPFEKLLEEVFGESAKQEFQRAEVEWGELEESLEDAVYELSVGDISSIIEASTGYYILMLENRIQDVMLTEWEFESKRKSVEKTLRQRKEAARSAEFVRLFMEDKHVKLKGKPFSAMTAELEKQIDFDSEVEGDSQPKIQMLAEPELRLLQNQLVDVLDEVLVEFKGGSWTVVEFLEKLWLQEVLINRKSPRAFRGGMQEAIRAMVRDELLAGEGYRRGLDRRASVRDEVKMWRDYFLYVFFKRRLRSQDMDERKVLQDLRNRVGVELNEDKLRDIELTKIPMIAVWTGFLRQLVVPMWPRFENGERDQCP